MDFDYSWGYTWGDGSSFSIAFFASSDSPFSLPDIKQLLFRQIVDEIGVVCKNKDVFLLSVGNGYLPEYEDFVRFVKDIKQDILNTVSQIEGFDKMSMVERQYMFIKERLFRIVREYGWTYHPGAGRESC